MKRKTVMTGILPGLIVFCADRIAKLLLDGVRAPLIPGVIALNGVRNTGMALGLLPGNPLAALLLSLAAAALCVLLLRKVRCGGLALFSISLAAGGALGNLFDRVLFGYVIDSFELLFIDFFIFNVADVAVVAGAALCGVSLLFRPQDWRSK